MGKIKSIENELGVIRQWFLENYEFNPLNTRIIGQKYDEILTLLENGSSLGMSFGDISYSSLHELFSLQLPRIRKILKPDGIILAAEIDRPVEDLYRDVCELIIIQLRPLGDGFIE